MKTEKNINPQSTTRNEDTTNPTNPSVTSGTTRPDEDTTKKTENEPWKNPDPTSPEKRQNIYAGKKEEPVKREEDYEGEGSTDEDIDSRPESKFTPGSRGKEDNDVETEHNQENQI